MRGDLHETSIADLCRGFADASTTGALELTSAAGTARIFFRDGAIAMATSPTPGARLGDRLLNGGFLTEEQLDEALAIQSGSSERVKLGALLVEQGMVSRDVIRVFVQEQILDALFEIMQWQDGRYRFNADEAAPDRLPVELSVGQMLVEVSRRQSEWDQIQVTIPNLDLVPQFVVGSSSTNAALEQDEFAMLASIDGERSIRGLAADLGYSEFEAARVAYGLALLGIVEFVEAEDEAEDGDDDQEQSEAEDLTLTDEPETAGRGDARSRPRVEVREDRIGQELEFELGFESEEPDEIAIGPEPEPIEDTTPPGEYVPSEPSEPLAGDLIGGVAEDDVDEPELWVGGQEDAVDEEYEPTPRPSPSADAAEPLDDDELQALLSELGSDPTGSPEVADADTAGTPPTESPLPQAEPAAESERPDEGPAGPEDEPTAPAARDRDEISSAMAALHEMSSESRLDETTAPSEPEDVAPAADTSSPETDATTPAPPEAPVAPERPAAAQEAAEQDGSRGVQPDRPSPPPPPQSGDQADVSEFLRELSRLALEEEEGEDEAPTGNSTRSKPSSTPAERSGRDDDKKQKKKGLFGWGS